MSDALRLNPPLHTATANYLNDINFRGHKFMFMSANFSKFAHPLKFLFANFPVLSSAKVNDGET